MVVSVHIPPPLRSVCSGATDISVSATNVSELLDQIARTHPHLYRCVCDETGSVRRHVNIFVNSSLVRDDSAFDMPLTSGDSITIFQAVSGG